MISFKRSTGLPRTRSELLAPPSKIPCLASGKHLAQLGKREIACSISISVAQGRKPQAAKKRAEALAAAVSRPTPASAIFFFHSHVAYVPELPDPVNGHGLIDCADEISDDAAVHQGDQEDATWITNQNAQPISVFHHKSSTTPYCAKS
jgi:hypothetical protein